jgi:vanillate O-demethylase ferredoxin subunit
MTPDVMDRPTMSQTRPQLDLRVASTTEVTPNVRVFRLESALGEKLPSSTPGAHIDLEVLIADRKEWRSYSLINPTSQCWYYEFAVQREDAGNGGSKYLHDSVKSQSAIRARVPQNNFPISDVAKRHLLVAGGIGVTPIYSIAKELVARNADVRTIFCARTENDAPFLQEMRNLLGERLQVHLDRGDRSRFFDFEQLVGVRQPGEHIYMCGPNSMMTRLVELCLKHSWPPSVVHREIFDPTKGETNEAFVAHLARSGRSLIVEADVSLLDALIQAGQEPFYDCRRGECGLCVVDVLKGEPLHRDSVLEPEDKRDKICTCVSRAVGSDITLDI